MYQRLITEIENQISEISELKKKTEIRLKRRSESKIMPEGILRAFRHNNGYQYYLRKDSVDPKGKYIKKQDIRIAELLAQNEYELNLLDILDEELSILNSTLSFVRESSWDKALNNMSQAKRSLVNLPYLSNEEFVKNWRNVEYTRLSFNDAYPSYMTNRGERVRSKSEVIIANMLDENDIPYLYEKPVVLENGINVHADFTVLKISERREVIWEHFGLLDDQDYRNKVMLKLKEYENSGYIPGKNFIYTFETLQYPLDTAMVKRKIEEYLL